MLYCLLLKLKKQNECTTSPSVKVKVNKYINTERL